MCVCACLCAYLALQFVVVVKVVQVYCVYVCACVPGTLVIIAAILANNYAISANIFVPGFRHAVRHRCALCDQLTERLRTSSWNTRQRAKNTAGRLVDAIGSSWLKSFVFAA